MRSIEVSPAKAQRRKEIRNDSLRLPLRLRAFAGEIFFEPVFEALSRLVSGG